MFAYHIIVIFKFTANQLCNPFLFTIRLQLLANKLNKPLLIVSYMINLNHEVRLRKSYSILICYIITSISYISIID